MANRLAIYTSAGVLTTSFDLGTSESVERPMPEDETTTPRGFHAGGGGGAQSLASGTYRLPRGVLVLRLTSAHRATFHTWMTDYLTGSYRLRHTPDTTDAGTYDQWKLSGTQPQERWEWLQQSDYWRTSLPVVDVYAITV